MTSGFELFISQLLNWSITEFCISDHVILTRSKCIWLNGILQSVEVLCAALFCCLNMFSVQSDLNSTVVFFQFSQQDFFRGRCSVFSHNLRIYLETFPFPLEVMFPIVVTLQFKWSIKGESVINFLRALMDIIYENLLTFFKKFASSLAA